MDGQHLMEGFHMLQLHLIPIQSVLHQLRHLIQNFAIRHDLIITHFASHLQLPTPHTMETPALTVTQLASLINRTASSAYDHDLRATGETDAHIIGRLHMLETIADRLALGDIDPTDSEDEALRSALGHLDRALGHLQLSNLITA